MWINPGNWVYFYCMKQKTIKVTIYCDLTKEDITVKLDAKPNETRFAQEWRAKKAYSKLSDSEKHLAAKRTRENRTRFLLNGIKLLQSASGKEATPFEKDLIKIIKKGQ